MPAELVVIRHGESEGNIALNASKNGDDSHLTEEFLNTHSSQWRLSERGREQARRTRSWFRREFPHGFDRCYVSEYSRAMETAALLEIPNARWRISPYLRERWWGDLDRLSYNERKERYRMSLRDSDSTPYYWRPPNGESLVEVCARLRHILATLRHECDGGTAVLVCHGEVMEALRIELEGMNEHDYMIWDEAKRHDSSLKIRNCQIWQYTSRAKPARLSNREYETDLAWRRSCLPSADSPELAVDGPWTRINRPTYSDRQLLEIVGGSVN